MKLASPALQVFVIVSNLDCYFRPETLYGLAHFALQVVFTRFCSESFLFEDDVRILFVNF